MNQNKSNSYGLVLFWLGAALIIFLSNINISSLYLSFTEAYEALVLVFIPLIASLLITFFYIYLLKPFRLFFSYMLFFSISITSLFGFTEALTGSHATSKNIFFYGLAFYSASFAFIIYTNKFNTRTFLTASNPLLLFTGPLAIFVKDIRYKSFINRVKYFLPFVVLGLFLFQTIATPLSLSLGLIKFTDSISSIVFAIIFELFIYANFCGLSLIIYGISGILGFKVPLNFRQPFSSNNIIDFWRGWHLSLSFVLKNLFYLPAKKAFGSSIAAITVFVASALWHGVTINFLIWGLLHATFFITSLYFIKRNHKILPLILLIIGIVLGRMVFADSNSSRLYEKLSFNYGFSGIEYMSTLPSTFFLSLGLIIIFILLEYFMQNNKYFLARNYKFFRIPFVQLIIIFLTLITLSTSIGVDFAVYGQR